MTYSNSLYIANSLLLTLGLLLFPVAAQGESPETRQNYTNNSLAKSQDISKFTVFPVGINVDKRTINTSALVKGAEDGSQAINFEQWLIPLDIVVEALNITVKPLENGQLELRSPGLITKINPQQLPTDPDLGLAFKVTQIRKILGVTTQFDLQEYAINFDPPWLNWEQNNTVTTPPINTEGLTEIAPADLTITTVGQRFRLNNRDLENSDFISQSSLSAVGTVFDGSWYVKVEQSDLFNLASWQLGELQYLRQTDSIDYALGSQSTFWHSHNEGQYWGLTSIKRFGFTPDNKSSASGFNPNLRRQPQTINRSIAGTARSGDVVHLVTRGRQEVIQEIVVDDRGSYQFEDVDFSNNNYQILVYPQGRLTVAPEVREPIITHVSGQLSQDTSTLTASLGMRRNFSDHSFWGNFTNLAGGVNYRRGITEELTLGTGLIVDGSLFALGEIFYQPANVPLQLGISTLINPQFQDADYTAYFNYQPTDKLNLNFNANASSYNFYVNWLALSNLSLRVGSDNRDDIITGLTFSKNTRNFSLLTNIDYGNNEGLSRRFDTRFNAFQFAHQGDREATFSRLSYSLSRDFYNPRGHALFLGYDTRNSGDSNNVINLGWHYRSAQNASDGGSLWDVELGYGFNSQGSAPLAAVTTRAIPGTTIRLSYEGISPVDDDSQVRIDVFPNLRLQGKPHLGDRHMDKLRTQGGLLIRPFADRNTNGKLDKGEEIHTEDAELLFKINHQSLYLLRKEITNRGVYVSLASGEYRLDLDPVGYPFNLKPIESAYAVRVTPGSYTKLDIPFSPSYTAIGVVTDSQGEPVAGARVEAISRQSDRPILSITNSAGVYFLEGLSQDTYNLTVNDRPVNLKPLEITPDSEPLQEINIQISD